MVFVFVSSLVYDFPEAVVIKYNVINFAWFQVTLGISTLLSYVPVSLGTAHQAGALTLLTFMLLLNHTVRRPSLSLLKSLPQVGKAH